MKLITYPEFRKSGMSAEQALQAGVTMCKWKALEDKGLVRIRAEPEEENYFDCYRRPDSERERKAIEAAIERYGNYCIVSEYFDGNEWQKADSIGHCAGYKNVLDPRENWYVTDLMDSAIDKQRTMSILGIVYELQTPNQTDRQNSDSSTLR